MKTKYIVIGVVILIVGVVCFMIFKKRDTIKEEDMDVTKIKSFYLTYTNGYAMNSYTRYQLRFDDGKYIAEIKPYGVSEDDLLEIEVDKEVMNKTVEILKKYEVNKWDGFDKTDQGVLDGDSFSLSVSLEEDKSISADGYMMWPEHYRDVVGEISPIFMDIYNNR